ISNRFDLLSELNISAGSFGVTVSGAAWYDTVYNSAPHADTSAPASFYPLPARFRSETRDLHGRDAELLNAFIYAGGELGGLPVAQVSASVQPATNWSLSAYYQFEWRHSRLPGVGSYFSAADFLDAGGRKLYVAPDRYVVRTPDQTPSSSGQFGAAVRYTDGDI